MMRNSGSPLRGRSARWGWGLVALLLPLLAGCPNAASLRSNITVTSLKDPYFPEPYAVTFDRCVYQTAADGDRHVLAVRASQGEGGEIRQYLHLHLFWKPRPGKTFSDPSINDSIAEYVIVTPQGSAAYSGTAFVYPRPLSDGRLRCPVERGNLRLETINGSPTEVLGDATLAGELIATEDAGLAVELRRLVARHLSGTPGEFSPTSAP